MTNYVYIFRPSIGQYIKIKFYEVIIEARYRFVVWMQLQSDNSLA